MLKIDISDDGMRFGHYEPGNGTAYRVIAFPWGFAGVEAGNLGYLEGTGWLVVSCMSTRQAMLISDDPESALEDYYIQDKLGGSVTDYPYFGDLVRKVVGRAGSTFISPVDLDSVVDEDNPSDNVTGRSSDYPFPDSLRD